MAAERVARSVSPVDTGIQLVYRHSGEGWTDPADRPIDRLSFNELLAFSGFPAAERAAFADPKRLRVMSNGWQSWSPAWELRAGDRLPRPRIVRKFALFLERPGRPRRRDVIDSHFFTYLRSGDAYVGIFSRNEAAAPVGFSIDGKRRAIRIDIYSEGQERSDGERLAELRIVWGRDFFEFKDKVAAVFSGFGLLDRLAFLKARQDRELVVHGWNSWYFHYANVDEGLAFKALDALDANENFLNRYCASRGKPIVFEIDDGWEIAIGDWEFNRERFPNGMKRVADRVRGKGFLPGIWIAPFLVSKISRIFHERPDWLLRDEKGRPVVVGWHPAWGGDIHALDLSREEVRKHLYAIFDRLVDDWGYRFIKLDFLYAGLFPGKRSGGGSAYRWYEEVLSRLAGRLENGEGRPMAYLGCGAPLEPSFRHFPLMRIGPDTRESWDYPAAKAANYSGRPSAWLCMKNTIGRALLDRSVFANDPDAIFLRSSGCALTHTEKELVALVALLFGSQLMTSDDLHDYPAGDEDAFTARIVDLFDRLSGDDYGATRLDEGVWRVRSRSGKVDGLINLSDRVWHAPDGFSLDPSRPIVSHVVKDPRRLRFERRSISLFASDGR